MKIQSAKQKGRNLQKYIAEAILANTSGLTTKDVKSTPMGTQGVDVMLSEAAFKQFPFNVEAKARKNMKGLYEFFKQAAMNSPDGHPLLVVKADREKPLAIVDFDLFMQLVKAKYGRKD